MANDTDEVERFDFILSKPINVFGEMTTVLKWREPNGADLIRVGNPVIAYPETDPIRIDHDLPKVIAMVARITGAPTSSLERMASTDITKWAWMLTRFFLPGA
jgi:hypothetical protein